MNILNLEIEKAGYIFFVQFTKSRGPYRSCAALLAISIPLILILVWSGLLVRMLTCEFICGQDGTHKHKKITSLYSIIFYFIYGFFLKLCGQESEKTN